MVIRVTDGLGEQSVFGRHFIQRRRGQRLREKLRAGSDAALHAGHDHVEIIERAERALAHGAALRRVWINVLEMLESFRIFNVAEQRQRVAPDLRLRLRERWELRQRCAQRAENRRGECRRCGSQDGSTTELHTNTPADRFRYAVAGNYVAFSVPRQRRALLPTSQQPQIYVTIAPRKTQRPGEDPAV